MAESRNEIKKKSGTPDSSARAKAGAGKAGGTRRPVFRAWVGISIVLAIAVAFLAPMTEAARNAQWWVAVVAGGMALLLFLGVGWLAVFVHSRRKS